jgi:hypothetical protein
MTRCIAKLLLFLLLCVLALEAVGLAQRGVFADGSAEVAVRQMTNDPAAPAAVQAWGAGESLLYTAAGLAMAGFGLFLFWPELRCVTRRAKELSHD